MVKKTNKFIRNKERPIRLLPNYVFIYQWSGGTQEAFAIKDKISLAYKYIHKYHTIITNEDCISYEDNKVLNLMYCIRSGVDHMKRLSILSPLGKPIGLCKECKAKNSKIL